MSKLSPGKVVPDFSLPATGEKTVTLSQLRGNLVVLYFYPKDSTPGCTTEGQEFRDFYLKFRRRNAIILGVSRDSLRSHENFRSKHGFQFDLISDTDEELCKLFDVIKEKNMYGRKVLGIERSTFLIDAEGVLRKEWRKVKVKGHDDEVFEEFKAL
jgi:peroxiredoxin Q/BCP